MREVRQVRDHHPGEETAHSRPSQSSRSQARGGQEALGTESARPQEAEKASPKRNHSTATFEISFILSYKNQEFVLKKTYKSILSKNNNNTKHANFYKCTKAFVHHLHGPISGHSTWERGLQVQESQLQTGSQRGVPTGTGGAGSRLLLSCPRPRRVTEPVLCWVG